MIYVATLAPVQLWSNSRLTLTLYWLLDSYAFDEAQQYGAGRSGFPWGPYLYTRFNNAKKHESSFTSSPGLSPSSQ